MPRYRRRKDGGGVLVRRSFAFNIKAVEDSGRFAGYASVFNVIDSYREVVVRGAFAVSLKRIAERGRPLPALWQHRSAEPVGGYDVLREDEQGLRVEGFLLKDDVERAREAHALMKSGVVSGLSIGYYVEDDSYNERERIRTLKQLDLVEVSIVTFPANPEARIDTVKEKVARGERLTMRELAEFLQHQGMPRADIERWARGERRSPADLAVVNAQLARIEVPKFTQ